MSPRLRLAGAAPQRHSVRAAGVRGLSRWLTVIVDAASGRLVETLAT